jgi:hypothetical protein
VGNASASSSHQHHSEKRVHHRTGLIFTIRIGNHSALPEAGGKGSSPASQGQFFMSRSRPYPSRVFRRITDSDLWFDVRSLPYSQGNDLMNTLILC